MDRRVQDFLVVSFGKVIDHYRQVLRSHSLTDQEREGIRNRLADVTAEFEAIRIGAES